MSFATAHGLGEDEYPLRRCARKASKGFLEESLHTIGEVIFVEEFSGLDAVFNEVGEIEDDISPVAVKHALAGFAELFE